jgi:hypothetical protein
LSGLERISQPLPASSIVVVDVVVVDDHVYVYVYVRWKTL